MTGWQQFAQTRYGYQLSRFFEKLNAEIADITSNPDMQDGILILNTKKGYWLYKVYEREEAARPVQVCSDRYAQKLMDYSVLHNKLIYLVDDTLIHGNGLFHTYRLLTEKIEDHRYICPIVFALHENIDLKERAESTDGIEHEFWSSLQYYVKMTDQQIGEFCVSVTDLLHSAGIPYVIDLPYLKDENYSDNKTNFEIQMTKQQFEELKKETDLWKFCPNSLQVLDVEFLRGFTIHMKDEPLLAAVRDCFIDFTVTGTYIEDGEENVRAVFVPFAMAKSVTRERMEQLWNLFAESISIKPDIKLTDDSIEDEVSDRMLVRGYRECIYFLSMVIAERFKKHLKEVTGISLVYDNEIIKEHFPGNFVKRAEAMEEKLKSEPDTIERKLLKLADTVIPERVMNDIVNSSLEVNNYILENSQREDTDRKQQKENYDAEKADKIILSKILEQRTDVLEGKKLRLLEAGSIYRLFEDKFSFRDNLEERYAQSQNMISFLMASLFGNRLWVSRNKKMILKGFRYGENSDLALTFLNRGFYWAVVLMSEKKGKEAMKGFYDRFIYDLRDLFSRRGLFDSYITEENFQENNQYFKNVVQNDLHLYNKSFYFRPYYRGELPKSEIRVMNEIEDFVANTGY